MGPSFDDSLDDPNCSVAWKFRADIYITHECAG
jgi:hypothetical protein